MRSTHRGAHLQGRICVGLFRQNAAGGVAECIICKMIPLGARRVAARTPVGISMLPRGLPCSGCPKEERGRARFAG